MLPELIDDRRRELVANRVSLAPFAVVVGESESVRSEGNYT
jgi:hypothetical protein